MARLIIMCLPVEDNVCRWSKAHADPLIGLGQGCVRLFFVPMARIA
jgi:hypothetical protein